MKQSSLQSPLHPVTIDIICWAARTLSCQRNSVGAWDNQGPRVAAEVEGIQGLGEFSFPVGQRYFYILISTTILVFG